jgi:hypothetical protein
MPNIETPEEFREFVDEIMDLGWRDQEFPNEGDDQMAYTKVAARDAAIRAECAKRAIAWCDSWNGYQILQPESGDTLRAAIMAEPPKAAL